MHFQKHLNRILTFKYEFLLVALILHLFIAAALPDLSFYTNYVWPINMVLLGIFSVGIFAGKSKKSRILKNILTFLVITFAILPKFITPSIEIMGLLSLCYLCFYMVIFAEVMRYLIRPSYISSDIVYASACGDLLLIEVGVFTMQIIYCTVPDSFKGLDTSTFTKTYLDIVYFCSITVTSIGFGDITPAHHISKLATAILGVLGQFYSVVLVGILISKYTAHQGSNA